MQFHAAWSNLDVVSGTLPPPPQPNFAPKVAPEPSPVVGICNFMLPGAIWMSFRVLYLHRHGAQPKYFALNARCWLASGTNVTGVLCVVPRQVACKCHRSHFGSRYKLGCCGHAGLFDHGFEPGWHHYSEGPRIALEMCAQICAGNVTWMQHA